MPLAQIAPLYPLLVAPLFSGLAIWSALRIRAAYRKRGRRQVDSRWHRDGQVARHGYQGTVIGALAAAARDALRSEPTTAGCSNPCCRPTRPLLTRTTEASPCPDELHADKGYDSPPLPPLPPQAGDQGPDRPTRC